jgi:hypothetical protein
MTPAEAISARKKTDSVTQNREERRRFGQIRAALMPRFLILQGKLRVKLGSIVRHCRENNSELKRKSPAVWPGYIDLYC